jgi:uncharacterized membrane protein
MKKLIILSSVALGLFLFSCHKDKAFPTTPIDPSVCDSVQVSFANDIQPMFDNYCNNNGSSCHNVSSASDGRTYETHAQIAADAEICYSAMNHEVGFTAMPLGNPTKLADSLLTKMNCWINDGKPNN